MGLLVAVLAGCVCVRSVLSYDADKKARQKVEEFRATDQQQWNQTVSTHQHHTPTRCY